MLCLGCRPLGAGPVWVRFVPRGRALTKRELTAAETLLLSSPELCLLPKVVGKCRAAFPRWWYNATSRACQRFTYGGCGANLNNFLVEDDCRVRCVAAGGECAGGSRCRFGLRPRVAWLLRSLAEGLGGCGVPGRSTRLPGREH